MSDELTNKINHVEDLISSLVKRRVEIDKKITELKSKRDKLQARYYSELRSKQVNWIEWSKKSYEWSIKAQDLLTKKFKLDEFRTHQLAAINATLSKSDVILLMPTGGGKSLCYQLPALIGNGMTLVVSPLLSLIEDQVYKLRNLKITTVQMTSGEKNDVKKMAFDYMNKKIGQPIKLMYVTPEWLSKSKRFMSALQKCHEHGNLDRIAIDEVHCCSQWGHDFRPDYKFLGLLKGMFPDVPIIGLTATATTAVIQDVQEMIDIPASVLIRAPFDRPNLNFKVMNKPDKLDSCLSLLEQLLTDEFKDQSGIIYTATIKDAQLINKGLRERGLKVREYYSDLEKEEKQDTHEKWIENKCQVIIATVAFGMGIDKSDVRFVIHHSMPKSMETLYQESGRAGRDGKPAQCIVLFRLGDYFRHSGLTKTKTEVKNVADILDYCLNYRTCRHKLIGVHFEENVDLKCGTMCDNCVNGDRLVMVNVAKACNQIYQVIDAGAKSDTNMTLIKLIDSWHKTCKVPITKVEAECIVGKLLLKGYLKETKNYTAYSVNCYLKKAHAMLVGEVEIEMLITGGLRRYLLLPPVGSKKRKFDDVEASPPVITLD